MEASTVYTCDAEPKTAKVTITAGGFGDFQILVNGEPVRRVTLRSGKCWTEFVSLMPGDTLGMSGPPESGYEIVWGFE